MQKPKPIKRYKCECWPEYRIRDLKFNEGILEVFSNNDVLLVENCNGFGVQFWEIPLDQPDEPVPSEFAHQGTMATQTTEVQEFGEVNEAVAPESVFEEPVWPQDEVKVLGGGYYEYQGKKVRGKKNLPPEVQDLV